MAEAQPDFSFVSHAWDGAPPSVEAPVATDPAFDESWTSLDHDPIYVPLPVVPPVGPRGLGAPGIWAHPPPPRIAHAPSVSKLDRLLRAVANKRPRGPYGPPYRPGVSVVNDARRAECQDPSYPPCDGWPSYLESKQAYQDALQDPDYPMGFPPRHGRKRLLPNGVDTGSIRVRGGPLELAVLIAPWRTPSRSVQRPAGRERARIGMLPWRTR